MARSISVKVPTATLIEKLEAKLAELEQAEIDFPAKVEQYKKDKEAYIGKVVVFIREYLKTAEVGTDYDSPVRISDRGMFGYNARAELLIDLDNIPNFPKSPEYPEKPNQQRHYGRDYTTQADLIKKNLNILRMTSQEEVNASTYGAIMEIL